jgi:hypothetical protein
LTRASSAGLDGLIEFPSSESCKCSVATVEHPTAPTQPGDSQRLVEPEMGSARELSSVYSLKVPAG